MWCPAPKISALKESRRSDDDAPRPRAFNYKQAIQEFKLEMQHFAGTNDTPGLAPLVYVHLAGIDPTADADITLSLKRYIQGSDDLKEMTRVYLKTPAGTVPVEIQGNPVSLRAGCSFCKNVSSVFCAAFMRTRTNPINQPHREPGWGSGLLL